MHSSGHNNFAGQQSLEKLYGETSWKLLILLAWVHILMLHGGKWTVSKPSNLTSVRKLCLCLPRVEHLQGEHGEQKNLMEPVICSRWPGTNLKLELGVLLLLQRFAELLLDPHDHQLHLDPDGVLVGLSVCLINKWLQVKLL